MCPSSAWPSGASFGQLTGLRHREGVRPLLLRLVTATAVLLAVGGCVSLPADGSPHDPGPSSGGRTVAPARPSPLVLPSQGSARERLVDVASARRKAKRPAASRKGHASPRHAAPGRRAERRPVGRPVPQPTHPVVSRPRPVPARTVPRQRHHVAPPPRAHRRPPRPRSTIDPGVVCRMAAGRVRGICCGCVIGRTDAEAAGTLRLSGTDAGSVRTLRRRCGRRVGPPRRPVGVRSGSRRGGPSRCRLRCGSGPGRSARGPRRRP